MRILTICRSQDASHLDPDTIDIAGVTLAYMITDEPVTLAPGTWSAMVPVSGNEDISVLVESIALGCGIGGN